MSHLLTTQFTAANNCGKLLFLGGDGVEQEVCVINMRFILVFVSPRLLGWLAWIVAPGENSSQTEICSVKSTQTSQFAICREM